MSKNNKSTASSPNNNSGGEGDDARKKRGNPQVERLTFKKVRSEKKTGIDYDEEAIGKASLEDENNNLHTKESGKPKPVESSLGGRVWDLESAILCLVQIGNTGDQKSRRDISTESSQNPVTANKTEETEPIDGADTPEATATGKSLDKKETQNEEHSLVVREYLTSEENSWITFCPAHAGDASTIAQWYRKQRSEDSHSRRRHRKSKHRSKEKRSDKHEATTISPSIGEEEEEEANEEPEEPELEKQPLRPSSSNEEEALSDRRRPKSKSSNDAALDDNGVEEEDVSSSLQLEHWLAEGLGDENTCPFVHGLLAYVHRSPPKGKGENDERTDPDSSEPTMTTLPKVIEEVEEKEDNHSGGSHHLAAVVLMSLSWAFGKRNLKIEWMSIDPSFRNEGLALQQKVWLRIHTLSSMTACQAISVDEEILLSAYVEEEQIQSEEKREEEEEEEEPLDGAASGKPSSRKNHLVEPSAE